MEQNELDPFLSVDAPIWDSAHLPAYMERWDGRRMTPNEYVDLFKAEVDPFIEGLRSEDGEQEVDRRSPLVSPLPRQQDTQRSVSEPPVGESKKQTEII